MDLYRYDRRIERALLKTKELCEETHTDVTEYVKNLKANNLSKGWIYKQIYFLKSLRILLGKSFRKASKEDIIELVGKVNQHPEWADKSKTDFKKILKLYFRWLKQTEEFPEEVKWIKTTSKRNNQKIPEQILTKAEVELIANAVNNQRDKALILILYESGCRISELLNMRIKDISFDQFGCYILVSGKTGWRRVRIIEYSKELLKWLDSHPIKTIPDADVWINLENLKGTITPAAVHKILKNISKKLSLTKSVHPHAFRHARATHLARHLPEAVMKQMFGWTNDSHMASVYYHLSGKDVDDALLKLHGIKTEEVKEENIGVKVCQKCGENNSILSHFCKKCSTPSDLKFMLEVDSKRKEFDNFMKEFLVYYAEIDKSFKKTFRQFVKERNYDYLFVQ